MKPVSFKGQNDETTKPKQPEEITTIYRDAKTENSFKLSYLSKSSSSSGFSESLSDHVPEISPTRPSSFNPFKVQQQVFEVTDAMNALSISIPQKSPSNLNPFAASAEILIQNGWNENEELEKQKALFDYCWKAQVEKGSENHPQPAQVKHEAIKSPSKSRILGNNGRKVGRTGLFHLAIGDVAKQATIKPTANSLKHSSTAGNKQVESQATKTDRIKTTGSRVHASYPEPKTIDLTVDPPPKIAPKKINGFGQIVELAKPAKIAAPTMTKSELFFEVELLAYHSPSQFEFQYNQKQLQSMTEEMK